jgi:hypothetical protein
MNRILLLSLIFSICFGTGLTAQKTVSKKEVKNIIKNMSDQKAKDALSYARTLYNPNAKKELENIVKAMTDQELRLLYDYLELINKYADKKAAQEKAKVEKFEEEASLQPKFSFEETSFDFGTIEEGEKVSHVYKFTNSGSKDLKIYTIKSSCGCAIPEWPKEAIAPGEAGEIKITFDSTGKLGVQSKRVTIYAETEPQTTFLFVVGEVMKKRE